MPAWLWILAFATALYALHRLALWMERRGWIYYAKNKPSVSTLGSAALSVQSILQPESKHVLEMKQERRVQRDDQGDPPEPDVPAHSADPPAQ